MKIRNGFVSNSSSSSFVIAYKRGVELPKEELGCQLEKLCPSAQVTCDKKSDCPKWKEQSIDLIDKINYGNCYDTEVDVEGYQNVLDYLKKECFLDVDEIIDIKEKMDRYKDVCDFYMISVGYRDELISYLMDEEKDKGNLKVIKDFDG